TATPSPTPTSTGTTTPCSMTFTDVQPSDYFYEAVRYLYCHGVISGYAGNTFRPYNLTTRSQLAKIAVLAFGLPLYIPPTPTSPPSPSCHEFRPPTPSPPGHISKTLHPASTSPPPDHPTLSPRPFRPQTPPN